MRMTLARAVLAALTLASCATDPAPADEDRRVPVTDRALAAVVDEHLDGTPSSASTATDIEELGDTAVGADLRFAATDEHAGTELTVAVGADLDPKLLRDFTACGAGTDGCAQVDGGTLLWEEEEPEEDPGVVYLLITKGDTTVLLFQSSEPITGDPRELDLQISVQDMLDIAQDPRVDTITSSQAVAAGEQLAYWGGPRDQ